jgi:hypothetical protein
MTDEVKNQLDMLKAEIAEWPKDEKRSFVGGITEGLCLGVLIAKAAGYDIAKDKDLKQLFSFLDHNCPPLKRRKVGAPKPKPARDQLFEDIKELLRRAIAGHLRIPKDTFDTSLDAEDQVNKCLLTVVAIGNRNALNDAIQDIQIMRSIAGGVVDRASVRSEVESCYERFRTEVDGVTEFKKLSKRGTIRPKDIWIYLRANVGLNCEYEDDDLREIDARYQTAA